MVILRRRAQSFSHLPRACLSHEEFLEYLGERTTTKHAGDTKPPLTSSDDSVTAPEATIVGVKENGIAVRDGNSQVSPVIVVEGVDGGACDGDGRGGEKIPRKRVVRRWPSSADIGMYTDGR